MLANVASRESLLSLIEDEAQLQESISAVKGMINLKKREAEGISKTQEFNYTQVTKLHELHSHITAQKTQDSSSKESDFSYTQGQHGQSSSQNFAQADKLHKDLSDHEDFIKDLQDFKQLAKNTEDWLKTLQRSHDTQETDTRSVPVKTKEKLQKLKVKK